MTSIGRGAEEIWQRSSARSAAILLAETAPQAARPPSVALCDSGLVYATVRLLKRSIPIKMRACESDGEGPKRVESKHPEEHTVPLQCKDRRNASGGQHLHAL